MKREIKFRAWNKEDKIMVDLQKITPLALNDMMNTQLNLQGRSGLFIPFFKELELMQYTGLKDRNGKEIYEGDIIKCKYGKATIESIEDIHQSLGWRDRKENSKCSDIGRTIEKFKNEIEIIGNVYKNKELLK